jgi:quercetin dioxygenase-like cupin family protein
LIIATPIHAERDEAGFVWLVPDELVWQDLESGITFTIIQGNPRQEEFYIIRARFAPGVFSAPHFHPNDRFVTVIKGTWWAGTGNVLDKENAVRLDPGGYMMHPAGAVHYDGSKGEEVIVQISGMGPAPIIFVDEAGNPID